uniref:Uncharacterized protein n=1 Tax=Oryza meridionalis TaxID=40149 RepID=A0A0E0F9K6_9ORYZ
QEVVGAVAVRPALAAESARHRRARGGGARRRWQPPLRARLVLGADEEASPLYARAAGKQLEIRGGDVRGLGLATARSLNGVLVADEILRLAPDAAAFHTTLRCVKESTSCSEDSAAPRRRIIRRRLAAASTKTQNDVLPPSPASVRRRCTDGLEESS